MIIKTKYKENFRYLLIGGGGFIGSHLCDALLGLGFSVRLMVRRNSPRYRTFKVDEKVEWFEGDFTNQLDLKKAIESCDVIYHMASSVLPDKSNENPIFDCESNVIKTLELLELIKKTQVSKIVFLSSGGTVYGKPKNVPIRESDPTNPIVSYGISKLMIEKYLHLYSVIYGLDYCVLRISNTFGERQKVNTSQGAIAVFLNRALQNQRVEIWGDGSVVRDYIYIEDVVDALLRAGDYKGDERVFNIGSGYGKSLNEVLDAIDEMLNVPINRIYMKGRSFDVPINILDISKARDLLDWKPKITFSQGLHRTFNWYQRLGMK